MRRDPIHQFLRDPDNKAKLFMGGDYWCYDYNYFPGGYWYYHAYFNISRSNLILDYFTFFNYLFL